MNSTHENFNRVVFPQSLAIATAEIPLGQTSKVVLRDSTSNAMTVVEFDLHSDIESDRGGAYVGLCPKTVLQGLSFKAGIRS